MGRWANNGVEDARRDREGDGRRGDEETGRARHTAAGVALVRYEEEPLDEAYLTALHLAVLPVAAAADAAAMASRIG